MVLVDAVGLEAVAASAVAVVVEGDLEVVLAQEPVEASQCVADPFFFACDVVGFEAGLECREGIDVLLVEAGSFLSAHKQAAVSHGGEVAVFEIEFDEPFQ